MDSPIMNIHFNKNQADSIRIHLTIIDFAGVIPILVLAILNCKIIQAMRRATFRHNNLATVQRR